MGAVQAICWSELCFLLSYCLPSFNSSFHLILMQKRETMRRNATPKQISDPKADFALVVSNVVFLSHLFRFCITEYVRWV